MGGAPRKFALPSRRDFHSFGGASTQHEGSLADPSGQLFPLSMQHKSGPEVGRRPAFLSGQFKLGRPQSRPRRHTIFEHALIKKLHQFGRRQIVDLPQTSDHARRAGVHKSARQPDQSLALDLFAKSRLARAEHDQIGIELEFDALSFVLQRPIC
jgi:hypothetical protein